MEIQKHTRFLLRCFKVFGGKWEDHRAEKFQMVLGKDGWIHCGVRQCSCSRGKGRRAGSHGITRMDDMARVCWDVTPKMSGSERVTTELHWVME